MTSSHDTSLDIAPPPRPPRRISRAFNTSPINIREGSVDSSASRTSQEPNHASHSQLNRLRGESIGEDEDIDRTPTKHNYLAISPREEVAGSYFRGPARQNYENSRSRAERSRLSVEDADVESLSVSDANEQASVAIPMTNSTTVT